jgi:hypothetical protein
MSIKQGKVFASRVVGRSLDDLSKTKLFIFLSMISSFRCAGFRGVEFNYLNLWLHRCYFFFPHFCSLCICAVCIEEQELVCRNAVEASSLVRVLLQSFRFTRALKPSGGSGAYVHIQEL